MARMQGVVHREIEVVVCVTCRHGETNESETRPGARLFEALQGADLPQNARVRSGPCMSNCTQGCTVLLRGRARDWGFVWGGIDPENTRDALLETIQKYAETRDGLIPWRERPEHFRKNTIARIPPMEIDHDIA